MLGFHSKPFRRREKYSELRSKPLSWRKNVWKLVPNHSRTKKQNTQMTIKTFSVLFQTSEWADRLWEYLAHRHMNVETGTVATQFLFWEYLFRIFCISSLQCVNCRYLNTWWAPWCPCRPALPPSSLCCWRSWCPAACPAAGWCVPSSPPPCSGSSWTRSSRQPATHNSVMLHNSGFWNGDITKQCLHLSLGFLFQQNQQKNLSC